jgi:DNA mismatch repair protein MutH
MIKDYKTKELILKEASKIGNNSLRNVMSNYIVDIGYIEEKIKKYKNNRKGLLGDLIEEFVFGLDMNNRSEADFRKAGIELKTNPIKRHATKQYVSKERLVFSMIDYMTVIKENWKTSSFLKKNKVLLIMFYLWMENESILDHKFKFIHLLDLLNDISEEDIYQIQKDWEFIVNKINKGEAHLLSEGDTFYLGACTKAVDSTVRREQPNSNIPAKPRAFSLKQQYLNYLIQTKLLGKKNDAESLFAQKQDLSTIEELVYNRLNRFIGKNDTEIKEMVGWDLKKDSKQWKRLLANRMLGVKSNNIEELEKANITLKAITLEHSGALKESMSFPAFNYKDLISQIWYDEEKDEMSEFHSQLESKRFLFVIFQKVKNSDEIIFRKSMFWNFPMEDISKAKNVWDKTIELINEGKIVKGFKTDKNNKKTRITFFP